jgi:hypothetical protein
LYKPVFLILTPKKRKKEPSNLHTINLFHDEHNCTLEFHVGEALTASEASETI